jgi:hypothetical protein
MRLDLVKSDLREGEVVEEAVAEAVGENKVLQKSPSDELRVIFVMLLLKQTLPY